MRKIFLAALAAASVSSVAGRAGFAADSGATLPKIARADAARKISPVAADFLVGYVAAGSGDYALAVKEFSAVLASQPKNSAVLDEDFEISALSGAPDTLVLARQLPHNPLAVMEIGNAEAALGHWNKAAAIFASLPEAGPFALMRPVLLAWCGAGSGLVIDALRSLQNASASSPLASLYLLNAALIADQAGQLNDAANFYRAAESNVAHMGLQFLIAEASFLARSGQEATAKGMLSDALSGLSETRLALPRLEADVARPAVSTPLQGLAGFYASIGMELARGADANAPNSRQAAAQQAQTEELSRVFLQMAIGLRPDLTAARLTAASEAERNGALDQALALLAPVGPDDALDPMVRIARVGILEQMGKTQDALAMLKQLAADYPKYAEPYALIGDADRQIGDFKAAVTAYDAALAQQPKLDSGDWVLLFDRAVASQAAGDWPAAERDLQLAIKLAPNEPGPLNMLGYSWADAGQHLPQARGLLEQAVKLDPHDGAVMDSLGWVEYRQGDIEQAVGTLQNAVQMQPEDPDINTHLGDAYAAAGRKLDARYQWQYALTLHPSTDAAAKLRAKLASLEDAEAKNP